MICPWEGRKEGKRGEAEVHLRASEEEEVRRGEDCIIAEGRWVGLLLCSKVRGSREYLFQFFWGSTDHYETRTITCRDIEFRYLPRRWSWECWCHSQRKATRPETSVCHPS